MTEATPQPQPPLPRNVKLFGWASFFNDVSSEMVFPLLPQFLLTVLGGNKFYLGAIEGAADSISSLVKLWSGGLADRVRSRKGLVVFGYALAAVSRPLIAVITLPWQLLGLRASDRIGKGLRTSPRDAMIADVTEPENRGRAFGFHRAMDHLGAALGPLLAMAAVWFLSGRIDSQSLDERDYRLLFLATLLPGILVVGLLALGLSDPRRSAAEPGKRFTWTLRPFDRGFRLYLLALVVFTLGNASDAFLLVRAGELGVPLALVPLLWTLFHVAKSAGNYYAGGLVSRLGARPMILAGWFLYALVYLAFAFATEAWHAWALFLAYAGFYSMTEPAEKTLVANLVGSENRGLAYGWFNFAVGVATLPASMMFGWLYQVYGPPAAFGAGAGAALAAAMLLGVARRKGQ